MPTRKTTYRAGLWNMKVGRDDQFVKSFLVWLLTKYRIKVMLLQEAGGYERILDSIPDYECLQFDSRPDSDNLAILVHKDFVSKYPWIRTMKKKWWGAENRRWRDARSVISLRAGGVRWINWHRVAYQRHDVNVEANREIDRKVAAYINSKPEADIALGGDVNAGARTPEMEEFRKLTNMKVRSVGGIDYFLVRLTGKVQFSDMLEVDDDGGSDHAPKVITVTREAK